MVQLESLANELLLDLFEFFDTTHLLQAFIGLNSRFNKLLNYHFQVHQLNLKSLSKEIFDNISEKLLPLIIDQVISLRLSSDETPGLPELLLSRGFTLNRFICLQSLSLYRINHFDTLYKIIYQCRYLPHLTHLNIVKYDDEERQENIVDLLNNIWSLSTLTHCNLNGLQTNEIRLLNISIISSSIEYLSIENIPCNLNCLSHLFKFTPRLQQFCTTLYSYSRNDHLTNIMPSIESIKLYFGGSIQSMNNLLENMPNLSRLIITTLQVYLDGNIWEQLISTYLPKLKRFHLKMELEFRENNNTIEETIDELLSSFRTPFWLQEHQWYVRCHWNPSDPYKWITLYTLPYSFDTFDYSNKSCTKSTCYDEQQYWSYDHVKIYGHGNVENTLLDNFSLLRARFHNIHHLQINLSFDNTFWSRFPSLNHLKSLHVYIYKYSDYYQLQTLFDQASCLYSLKLQSFIDSSIKLFELTTSKSIRRIDLINILFNRSIYYTKEDCFTLINSILGIQCEILSIRIKHRINILDLIRHMSKLRLLIFECEDDKEFFRNFSSSKNELVQWLQYYLSSTHIITRHPRQPSLIRIWINRETKKILPLNSDILKMKHRNTLSYVLTSFRQYFNKILGN
ncbi:unnamed protein product [Rotaria sordida]|uniref:F-box domain-containing protein n=1 Tax=Rotaria sordida TaxID=392033 RepID=A0A814WEB3_9BILA|nr:unnamed protein product [Rotaria sordida]CAF3681976.1 unnamed protein product [Rotaria sordida]